MIQQNPINQGFSPVTAHLPWLSKPMKSHGIFGLGDWDSHPYICQLYITGWWLTYPSETYEMKVSWDYYSQLNGKIKHVPNHQSDQPSSCAPSWHSFRPSDSAWARTSFKAFLGDRTVAQPCKKPWVFYRHKCARCMQQTLVGGLNHLERYESQWEGLS